MSTMQAPDTEIVSGQIVGITQKGTDKWQVAVQPPGSQYTRNLWTKDVDLVNSLSALIGSTQAFLCGISNWTNQQGQAVRSLWINGVGPQSTQPQVSPQQAVAQAFGQAQPQQAQPQQQTSASPALPQQQAAYIDSTETKIHRQTATKVAAWLLPLLNKEHQNFSTLLDLSEKLVHYYNHGLPQHNPEPDYDPSLPEEEDIPF